MPVVYVRLRQLKRGFYEIEFSDVCSDPASTRQGEITEQVTQLLEADIRKVPFLWLWSHKRWKHKRPSGL